MFRLMVGFLLLARSVAAEVPVVVADIAPVHGLVSQVMEGVGQGAETPVLLLPPGVSPHGYALRPSQARALQRADVVVWVGPALTPWLEKPLTSLAGQARALDLLDSVPDLVMNYAADEHGEEGGSAEHTDEHGEEIHHHQGPDPHAWLDPRVAARWTGVIADTLAAADPANAARYHANAAQAVQGLLALEADMTARLDPLRNTPFVTFHDAYRYLQRRFGLTNAGTVRTGDATAPGAARIAALRDTIAASGAECAFTEPQFDPSILRAAGGSIRIATLDPMGAGLTPGADFYAALMRNLTDALVTCLQ